ncbi:hypothetical protein LGH70_20835 [Hymenobacter sp. BT635]|uniref:HMA domain-containing protein n=1 Tax=Hymenobacter nitidus TaxID=2880929 RepID=A0ABS8AHY8_9BACT|nr:hypothetical protein [Hymenobacter nitidus]MCB2380053.1 hypothetical protein [Hymenobacter nitidus]
MVEVFKTNVTARRQARLLLNQIHNTFTQYRANFDLEDCDKVLRVESHTGLVSPACLISLLQEAGFQAEVLPD